MWAAGIGAGFAICSCVTLRKSSALSAPPTAARNRAHCNNSTDTQVVQIK